jgi:hypothetical protein
VEPITWNAKTVTDSNGDPASCQDEAGDCDCSKYVTTP